MDSRELSGEHLITETVKALNNLYPPLFIRTAASAVLNKYHHLQDELVSFDWFLNKVSDYLHQNVTQ